MSCLNNPAAVKLLFSRERAVLAVRLVSGDTGRAQCGHCDNSSFHRRGQFSGALGVSVHVQLALAKVKFFLGLSYRVFVHCVLVFSLSCEPFVFNPAWQATSSRFILTLF